MKIGKYIIDDKWTTSSIIDSWRCHKNIFNFSPFCCGIILIYKNHNHYELRIDLLYKEYSSIFGNNRSFSSIEEAKQSVDTFLAKFNRLAVFL